MNGPKPQQSGGIPLFEKRAVETCSDRKAVDSLDSLSFSRRGLNLPLLAPREIEIRYLVPPDLLASIIGSISPKEIQQHYFPTSSLKLLLQRFSVYDQVAGADIFNSARVRRTEYPDGERSYEIEFKGSKQELNGLRISRAEFGRSISREEFKELRKTATLGMVKKLRYDVKGLIFVAQERYPANAQVDVFKMAGSPPQKIAQQYVTVDIELDTENLVAPFCQGQHSFSFLSKCVDMSANDARMMRHLSSTQVACNGLGKKQLAALNYANQVLASRASEAQE